MRHLAIAGALALLCLTHAAQARPLSITPSRAHMADLVIAAAHRHGVPAALAYAVAQTESSFNPRARSHSGALGLMQIMPSTARDMGCRGSLMHPAANADCGTRILAVLLRDAHGRWAVAAARYNAGRFARAGVGSRYASLVLRRARKVPA